MTFSLDAGDGEQKKKPIDDEFNDAKQSNHNEKVPKFIRYNKLYNGGRKNPDTDSQMNDITLINFYE